MILNKNMLYLIIYILMYVSSLIEIFKIKKIYYLILFLFLVFFGFRGYVGSDWVSYSVSYQNINSIFDFFQGKEEIYKSGSYEIGFEIYLRTIKFFSKDYHFFVLVNVIVDIFLINIIIKYNNIENRVFFLFCYISLSGILFQFDILRNSKSVLIFLLSLRYIDNKKVGKYIVLNFLGMLFHTSSLIYILLYPLLKTKIKRRGILFVILITNLIYFTDIFDIKKIVELCSVFLPRITKEKIIQYLSHSVYSKESRISLGIVEKNMLLFYLIIFYKKIFQNENRKVFLNMFIIYLISYSFSRKFYLFKDRVLILFIPSYWFIYSFIVQTQKTRIKKLIFLTILSCYLFLNLVIGQNRFEDEKDKFKREYDNILFKIIPYEERMMNIIKINDERLKQ